MSIGSLLLWLGIMCLFLLVNAFFVAAEFSLVASRKSRIKELEEQGHPGAATVAHLKKNIDYSVSGTQLGITLASLAMGWIGEESIHVLVQMLLDHVPGLAGFTPPSGLGFALSFLTLSTLHVVIGEQVPKFMALRMPETLILVLAKPFRIYAFFAWPLIWTMNKLASGVLWILRVPKPEGGEHAVHSAEELGILIEESQKAGELEIREAELLTRVLRMSDLKVEDVMVPRKLSDCVSSNLGLIELLSVVAQTKHSKLPVYRGTTDTIIGVLHSRDLFDAWVKATPCDQSGIAHLTAATGPTPFSVESVMRDAYLVNKNTSASELLDDLRKRKIQMACVIDDEGKCVGLITMEDLLEELVGEIYDEYDKVANRPSKSDSKKPK